MIRLLTVILLLTGLSARWNMAYALSGNGTESSPYLIGSADDWKAFATEVNSSTSPICAILTNDIVVKLDQSHRVGNSSHPFRGKFDGQGNTITLEYALFAVDNVALFSYVKNATIENVIVNGEFKTSGQYASGLVSQCLGSNAVRIQNCIVSATLSFAPTAPIFNAYMAGFVANKNGCILYIDDCLFNGKLVGGSVSGYTDKVKYCAGFVASGEGSPSFSYCLFDPQEVISIGPENCSTFTNGSFSLTYSYYCSSWPEGGLQGYDGRNMSATELVAKLNGNRSDDQKCWEEKDGKAMLNLSRYVTLYSRLENSSSNNPFMRGMKAGQTVTYTYQANQTGDWVTSKPTISGRHNVKASVTGGNGLPWESTATFIIAKKPSAAATSFTYNRADQTLLASSYTQPTNVTYHYRKQGDTEWTSTIPTGKNAGTYNIEFWVEDKDAAHNHIGSADEPAGTVAVTINQKSVTPTVTPNSTSLVYTGSGVESGVTVKDGDDVIPEEEYTITYTNNVNVGTATATVTKKGSGVNYDISGSTSLNFEIVKSPLTITPPKPKTLIYNTSPQELVEAAVIAGPPPLDACVARYCLDDVNYSVGIPTGTNVGTYTVYYRVDGDANHIGQDPATVSVTINPKTLTNPTIIMSPSVYTYDGTTKEPTITVKDGDTLVPASEYTVSYSENKDVGTAKVTITDNEGGNYTVSGSASFSIVAAGADYTPPTAKTALVYNGAEQELIIAGTATGGSMEYNLDGGEFSSKIPVGTDARQYLVGYRVVGDKNHDGSAPVTLNVTISPKTVAAPVITLEPSSFYYDGNPKQPAVTVKDGETEIPASEYFVRYTDNTAMGTATVIVSDKTGGNYTVSGTANFSIIDPETGIVPPTTVAGLVYNRAAQELIKDGVAPDGYSMVYSLDNKTYYTKLPTGTDAKEYTVYYKVVDKDNKDVTKAATVKVTISPKTVKITVTVNSNGPNRVPSLTVVDEEGTKLSTNDYEITYKNSAGKVVTPSNDMLRSGDYAVTIKPVGNYTGQSVTKTIHIESSFSFVFTVENDLIPICLPYDGDVPSDYHVYYFDRIDDNGMPVFKRILTTKIRAGKPYLLRYVGSSASTRTTRTLDLTPSNPALVDITTTISVEYIGDMMFMGTFDNLTSYKAHADGAYLLLSNNTWQVPEDKGDAISLEAFHAYLRYMDRSTPYDTMTMTLKATTNPDDIEPTALDQVILDEADGGEAWYDLQGRRLDSPQRGMNIIRSSDGKTRKVIIR